MLWRVQYSGTAEVAAQLTKHFSPRFVRVSRYVNLLFAAFTAKQQVTCYAHSVAVSKIVRLRFARFHGSSSQLRNMHSSMYSSNILLSMRCAGVGAGNGLLYYTDTMQHCYLCYTATLLCYNAVLLCRTALPYWLCFAQSATILDHSTHFFSCSEEAPMEESCHPCADTPTFLAILAAATTCSTLDIVGGYFQPGCVEEGCKRQQSVCALLQF